MIFFCTSFLSQDITNTLEIIVLINQMVWSMAIIFSACEFGERLSETFDKISFSYDQLSWYLFPSSAQHTLITQLVVAQKPVELSVIGEISCCRITLKNVSKISIFPKNIQKNSKLTSVHL